MVVRSTNARTYMKMGTAGIGLTLGAQKYQVVFLMQDSKTFEQFVDKGWQADAGASAVAGKAGVGVMTDFVNGLAVYQLTEKGLMANADIAGTAIRVGVHRPDEALIDIERGEREK